ncbi:MAG: serine/threonine-protein kinase [Byssovorax sp.]
MRIGEILAGKYRVERLLGVGAMGIVVAATHVDLLEVRAIKFMLPSMLGDKEGVERFLREARAVSKLRSRHVATVFDVGRLDTGAPYIVMEHLDGVDLKTLLDRRSVLAPGEAAAYVSEACEALAEAHAAGIVHRDLKPGNLFVATRRDGLPTIKVLDFGIAKMIAASGEAAAMEMTKTTDILGTPLYMAPEQMRSMRNADARSDVWSLGVILYRSLTGKLPFTGNTVTEVCMAVLGDTPARPSALRPDLPPGLDAVVLGCLEKDPARRIGSAAELAIALAPFVVAGARAPLGSFGLEHSLASAPSPPRVEDATGAATLVWKPGGAELHDKTGARASWAQTGRRAPPRSRRPWLAGATGFTVLVLALAVVGGWRRLSHPDAPAAAAAIDGTAGSPSSSIEARPVASAPLVAPPPPANDPPVAAASATAKAVARTKPTASSAAPRPSAIAAPPVASPPPRPPSTGDTFGGGRY